MHVTNPAQIGLGFLPLHDIAHNQLSDSVRSHSSQPSLPKMADKVSKIVARLQTRISEGQFYEAQQQARVVAARHVKAHNHAAAVDVLASVAQSLLRAGQGASAGDLCIALVDVYRAAEEPPSPQSRDRLLGCLRLFDPAEPTRRKYINEMVQYVGCPCPFGCYDL